MASSAGQTALAPRSFLDLPAEIRNQIYKYLLRYLADMDIFLRGERIVAWRHSEDRSHCSIYSMRRKNVFTHILATCHAINTEAAPILYGTGTFYFECIETIEPFAHRIGARNATFIQRASIYDPVLDLLNMTDTHGQLERGLWHCRFCQTSRWNLLGSRT